MCKLKLAINQDEWGFSWPVEAEIVGPRPASFEANSSGSGNRGVEILGVGMLNSFSGRNMALTSSAKDNVKDRGRGSVNIQIARTVPQ